MCGITGWFSKQPFQADSTRKLKQMRELLLHRGPDGQGLWLDRHAALAHTRLAIVDLNQGDQPMVSHDQAVIISYNGEIYNYRELRHDLTARRYPFQTFSDTEIIIALYQSYGVAGFNQLRGMFAFALWDKRNRKACLVRDSQGIKPLFYFQNNDELVFASEAKAILQKHPECASLNTDNLHALMNFRYLPGTRTLFKNIQQLKPGEILLWQPETGNQHYQIDVDLESANSPSTLTALSNSVKAHVNADVEIGAYLSGGIDSAAICALTQRHYKPELQTFTLATGDDPDEANNARHTADYLRLPNVCESIPYSLEKTLEEMVWHLEVPKINALQIKLLAQLTAGHVKVALSGLGADELFCGYRVHQYMLWCRQIDKYTPRLLSRSAGLSLQGLLQIFQRAPYTESQRMFAVLANMGKWPQVYGLFRNIWDSPQMREKIYGPRLLDSTLTPAYDIIETNWPQQNDPLSACLEFESQQKLVNDLLWQEDRMSMAHGLEVRVPYVDTYLKAGLQKIPLDQHLSCSKLKLHLKKSVMPLLSPAIINRRKSGFQVNAPTFFMEHLQPLARRYLNPDAIKAFGLFNPAFIKRILKYKPHKRFRWHYFILYLMILSHIWVEQFEHK